MGFIISGAVINPSYYISALTISGGSSETRTRNTTIDSSGNMYICGSMKPSTKSESYIAKFDNTGAVVWQTKFAGVYGYDETIGIIVDATGNVYTTGTVTVSSGREYISIFKFDSSGTLQWQRILGNVDYSYRGTSIDVDSSGNIYVGGRSYTTPGSSRSQVFIAKYDSSANLLWQRQLGTSNDDNGVNAIKVDSSGSNVYIAGTVDNGNFYQISIVAKYNSSGAIQWQRTITKSGVNNKLINANGLGLDSSNNVYIVGNSNITTPSFGYILKYDSSGTEQWQRFFTDNVDSQQTTFQSVAVDGTGNAYVAGGTGSKAILVKYDTSGSIQWQRTLNSNTYEFAYDISINSDSLFFVAMTTVSGSTQGLIGKLPLDGSRTGSYSIGAYSFTYAASSLTGSAGSLASSTSSITEAAGEGSSSTSTFATSTPTLARTLASVGAAGGAIASGMTMGGTGLGMVISSYVAPVSGATTTKAIFGFGYAGSEVSITNLVSNTGVVATDTTGVGSVRYSLAAAGYGTDKAIFGYGIVNTSPYYRSMTNKVSNTGVVATDTAGVGTARNALAAAGYGTDKAIFGYGDSSGGVNTKTNLVSNTGVVATDTTSAGTARSWLAAASYGTDTAIFGYGEGAGYFSLTNLVSNTGVVSANVTGVGTARSSLAAAGYGTDKAIFGYGVGSVSMTNKVSNTGVVSADTTGVGTGRLQLAAAGYGADKAIFGYGSGPVSMTNLVSNTGVVATDTTGVGTARQGLAAAGYSQA